jgi:uncharacterized membrane protein YcjF (UPF0283 family)
MSDEFVSAAPGLVDAQPASQQQSRTGAQAVLDLVKRHRVWALLAAAALIGLVVLAIGGYFFGWTWTGFAGNTVWDWLSLLFTPVAIGAATIAFTIQQSQRGLAESERQRQFTLQIADIRQQESALEASLDHISHLLIENDLKQSPPGSAVCEAARARTLATLQRVGPGHRGVILRFLGESGLLDKVGPIAESSEAKVSEAEPQTASPASARGAEAV